MFVTELIKEMLLWLRIHVNCCYFLFSGRADKPVELDQHLYEFGSVEYHVQVLLADQLLTYSRLNKK